MTGAPPDPEDKLIGSLRLRSARQARWRREGAPSTARRLGQIGILGWIVVVPMLLGAFAGRWLDTRFGTGVFWTAPLMLAGLALGCWSGWKWMSGA